MRKQLGGYSARTWGWYALCFIGIATRASAGNDTCGQAFTHPEVVAAIATIRGSIDPCGESAQIDAMLVRYEECARNAYAVCIDRKTERNSTDRAERPDGEDVFITWNPDLRTELEMGCGGDPQRAVLRDPNASLLHEIAHVVQDCGGLDPNAYELEAVRIENIYRRAHGLCQRTAYGTQPLPAQMVLECAPGRCQCATKGDVLLAGSPAPMAQAASAAGDGASTHP